MSDLAELNIRISTLEAKVAAQDLDALTKAGKNAETTMDGLTKAAKYLAAAFATYKVASYVQDAALLAARYQTLGVVMEQIGKTAGVSMQRMYDVEMAMRKGGITAQESRNSIIAMIQAQIALAEASTLARAAQDAAVIGGINSSEAFGRMVAGIQKGDTEILREIGINVDFEASYKRLGLELNKNSDALTQREKTLARTRAVEEVAARNVGVYEAALTTAGKKISSLPRYFEEFKRNLGTPLLPATSTLVDELTYTMKDLGIKVQDPRIQAGLEHIASAVADVVVKFREWALSLDETDFDNFANGIKSLGDALSSIPDRFAGISNSWNSIDPRLRGALVGGATGFLFTKNGAGTLAGAVIGGIYEDVNQSIDEFEKVRTQIFKTKTAQTDLVSAHVSGAKLISSYSSSSASTYVSSESSKQRATETTTDYFYRLQGRLEELKSRYDKLNNTPIKTDATNHALKETSDQIDDIRSKLDKLNNQDVKIGVNTQELTEAIATLNKLLEGTALDKVRKAQGSLGNVNAVEATLQADLVKANEAKAQDESAVKFFTDNLDKAKAEGAGEAVKFFTEQLEKANAALTNDAGIIKTITDKLSDTSYAKSVYSNKVDEAKKEQASKTELYSAMPKDERNQMLVNEVGKNLSGFYNETLSLGLKYARGAKDLSSGAQDCSGWIANWFKALDKNMGQELRAAGTDGAIFSAVSKSNSSGAMIQKLQNATGTMLQGAAKSINIDALKTGMLLGFDTGPKDWDKDHYRGIDHIVAFYRDATTGAAKIVEMSSHGLRMTDASTYLKRVGGGKAMAYVVDPLAAQRDKTDRSLADYAKDSNDIVSLKKESTNKINYIEMGEYQYKRTLIQQEIDEVHKRDAYINASAEERAAIDAQLAQSRSAQLKELDRDEEQSMINKANLWKEYGQAVGDVSMLGQGRQLEVSLWEKAQEFDLRKKFPAGPELDKMIDVLHLLANNKSAQIKLETAGSFEEYASAYNQINSEEKKAQEARLQIYEQDLQGFSEISSKMVLVRMAAYDEIIAAAQKAGDKESEAFSKVNKEDAMEKTLKDIQKYGNATDAFYATLSLKFGTYKDDMSRMRDNAKMLGESLFDLSRDISSAIGDTFGDLLKGLAQGSLDMEDIWSSLLENLGNAFSNFAQKILEQWLNNIFDSIAKQFTGDFLSGLFGSTANSSWSLLSIFGFANGGAFSGTTLPTNSILTSPTLFTTADSGFHAFASGGLGVAGEKGYEAIMPLKRMSNNDLGVKVDVGQKNQSSKPTNVTANVVIDRPNGASDVHP